MARVQYIRRIGCVLLTSAIVGVLPAAAQTEGGQPQPANGGQSQPASPPPQVTVQATSPPSSPLAIHVGDADLLIGGFMDAMLVSRSTNTGNGIRERCDQSDAATHGKTGGKPQRDAPSVQNSRLAPGDERRHDIGLKGYVEVDFLGTPPLI